MASDKGRTEVSKETLRHQQLFFEHAKDANDRENLRSSALQSKAGIVITASGVSIAFYSSQDSLPIAVKTLAAVLGLVAIVVAAFALTPRKVAGSMEPDLRVGMNQSYPNLVRELAESHAAVAKNKARSAEINAKRVQVAFWILISSFVVIVLSMLVAALIALCEGR